MEFVFSFNSICKEFMEIKTPNCLPFCISELCGGCTYLKKTKKKKSF